MNYKTSTPELPVFPGVLEPVCSIYVKLFPGREKISLLMYFNHALNQQNAYWLTLVLLFNVPGCATTNTNMCILFILSFL